MTITRYAAPLTLFLAFAVTAQTDPTPTAKPQTFTIDAGTHGIPELTDRVAAFLDCNILYTTAELEGAGKIRTTRRTEVDAKGCWELFGTLLYHKGLAIVTMDEARGFHEIIAMSGQRQREIANGAMFVKSENIEAYAGHKATPILTTVPLKNINATIATNALRPFFASTGSPAGGGSLTLGNVGNNTDMLVQGYGPQVAAACRMLRLIDVRSDEPSDQVQVVRLEHANANDIVASIEAAWANRRAIQQAQMQVQGLPAANPNLRAVAHPALNAVILTGSAASVTESMQLIARLDAPAVAQKPASADLLRRIEQLEARLAALEGHKHAK